MCKTPKAPNIEIPEPVILSNPFLDAKRSKSGVVDALRTGRSALRIPLGANQGLFTPRTNTGGAPAGTSGAAGNTGRGPQGRTPLTTTPLTSGGRNNLN